MAPEAVSVKYFRENFPEIKEQLENGYSFTLMYRSSPLADIIPRTRHRKAHATSREEKIRKNIEKVKQFAGGLKLKTKLTPERINQMLDKRYEEMLH